MRLNFVKEPIRLAKPVMSPMRSPKRDARSHSLRAAAHRVFNVDMSSAPSISNKESPYRNEFLRPQSRRGSSASTQPPMRVRLVLYQSIIRLSPSSRGVFASKPKYPLLSNRSAKYEPSCPVMPVMNALFIVTRVMPEQAESVVANVNSPDCTASSKSTMLSQPRCLPRPPRSRRHWLADRRGAVSSRRPCREQ